MKRNLLALFLSLNLLPRLYSADCLESKGPEIPVRVNRGIAGEFAGDRAPLSWGEETPSIINPGSIHASRAEETALGRILAPKSATPSETSSNPQVLSSFPLAAASSSKEGLRSKNSYTPEASALSAKTVLKKASKIAAALSSKFLLAANEVSGPAQVIVIRHGEKPPVGNHLNDRGRARAQALVGFFKNSPEATQYGTPAAIYAMKPSSDDGSFRPIETVTPLAQSLGLQIIEDYAKKDGLAMIQAIMSNANYAGKMILICWEHHDIVNLVHDLGWDSGPDTWKGDVFDRAWVLNFENGKPVSFKDVPEHILPGDSAN